VLYNLLCDELGLSTEAFETPTHVYTIFTNISEQVIVENTTSMGFNIMQNLHRYSEYLLEYYPENEALKIGLDRLYVYENSKGRKINNTELLGLICYNLAIFNAEKKDYEQAYDDVIFAQLFNADSRSNRKFESSLYYRWGEELFKQKKFYLAFEAMADAFYRYPDNDDFKRNCQTAFINALQQLWLEKDWEKTETLVREMDDLNIVTERESVVQQKTLTDWINFFTAHQRSQEAEGAAGLYKKYYR
jgi:tetratricopeptide (TPR) repeat protein